MVEYSEVPEVDSRNDSNLVRCMEQEALETTRHALAAERERNKQLEADKKWAAVQYRNLELELTEANR